MKKKKFLSINIFVLSVSIILVACASNSNSNITATKNSKSNDNLDLDVASDTDKGFETPEKAMIYFTEQIAKGDFNEAVKAFAIIQKAEHYNLGKQLDQLQAWNPGAYFLSYPSEDKSFLQANKVFVEAEAMQQIANMCFSLVAESEYLQQTTVPNPNNQGEEIANSFLLHDLETLKITKFEYISSDHQDSEPNQKNLAKKNEIYGSNDFEEYMVYYRWNNQNYRGSATFVQYGDLWYLFSLQSNLAGDASNCYLEKIY